MRLTPQSLLFSGSHLEPPDIPAEVSEMESVRRAREAWATRRPTERNFL